MLYQLSYASSSAACFQPLAIQKPSGAPKSTRTHGSFPPTTAQNLRYHTAARRANGGKTEAKTASPHPAKRHIRHSLPTRHAPFPILILRPNLRPKSTRLPPFPAPAPSSSRPATLFLAAPQSHAMNRNRLAAIFVLLLACAALVPAQPAPSRSDETSAADLDEVSAVCMPISGSGFKAGDLVYVTAP